MARKFYTDIDLLSTARVVNLVASTATGHAVEHDQLTTALATKQDTMSIDAGSQNFLDLTAGVLSVKDLLISDVHVEPTQATIADFVTNEYSVGTEFQEGDTIILSTASPVETYMHNGGSAGTTADFTKINANNVSDASIRALMSGGDGIAYNSTTGEIVADVDDTSIEIDGGGKISIKNGSITEAMLDYTSIDGYTLELASNYVAADASGSFQGISAFDAFESVLGALDGNQKELISRANAASAVYRASAVSLTAATAFEIVHGLSNDNVIVQISDSSTGEVVNVDIDLKMGTTGSAEVTSDTNITVDIIVMG